MKLLSIDSNSLHYARQDGQDGENRKENHATIKIRKYGMYETLVKSSHQNIPW